MKKRKQILVDLFNLKGNLNELQYELSKYPWDSETPLILVKKINFVNSLLKFLNNDLLFLEVEFWANIIECRDDIEFESEDIKEYIFELANPYLYGEITKEKLIEIIQNIQLKL